ncbi:DUF3800 domain-containing protein [Aerococcus viridans]
MIEVYCDESRPETLYGENSKDKYMVIGGIWIPASERNKVKNKINYLKKIYGINNEVKWKNVSPSKEDFYLDLIDYFFSNRNIRFRCIVVDSSKVNMEIYHNSDSELGFYKFYYQVLNKWCEGNESYWIYLDYKSNKMGNRLHVLKDILNNATFSDIKEVQAINSSESVFIQMADILIGAVGYIFNGYSESNAKLNVIRRIEKYIDQPLQATTSTERKFNIFKIELR